MVRRFKSNNHRRLALKRAHRKINLRRQFFHNREFFSQPCQSDQEAETAQTESTQSKN